MNNIDNDMHRDAIYDDDIYDDDIYSWGSNCRSVFERNFCGGVDLEGRPIKHTKLSHPYSYDGHVITRMRKNAERMESAYTDRMFNWDRPFMERLTKKHLKNYRWDTAPGVCIEALLREWADDPGLQLIAVMEWCNHATGYPVWSLHWTYSDERLKEMDKEAKANAIKRGCFSCDKRLDSSASLDDSNGYWRAFCKDCAPVNLGLSE